MVGDTASHQALTDFEISYLKEMNMKTRIHGKTLALSAIAGAWLAVAATPLYAADGEAVFNKTCKLCHGTGVMNAPKAGDAQVVGD